MNTLQAINPDEHAAPPTTAPAERVETAGRGHHYRLRIAAAIVGAGLALMAIPLLLAFVAPSPAMAATMSFPPLGPDVPRPRIPAQIHTLVTGGMPGWQITLIAAGAAVLAAVLAVAADRALTARRHLTAPTL